MTSEKDTLKQIQRIHLGMSELWKELNKQLDAIIRRTKVQNLLLRSALEHEKRLRVLEENARRKNEQNKH